MNIGLDEDALDFERSLKRDSASKMMGIGIGRALGVQCLAISPARTGRRRMLSRIGFDFPHECRKVTASLRSDKFSDTYQT